MDLISDMLIRIKNAQSAFQPSVDIPYSLLKYNIANILVKEGFIEDLEKKFKKQKKFLKLTLKYNNDKEPQIKGIKIISKPGRRVYAAAKKIKSSKGAYGLIIVSTSQGVMTHKEAKKRNLGGEIICEIW